MSSVAVAVRARSFRVALELTASGHHPAIRGRKPLSGPLAASDYWIELTSPRDLDLIADPPEVVRITASDLREAQRMRAGIRADAIAAGRDPDEITVLLDLDTLLAPTAAIARAELAQLDSSFAELRSAVTYIGTPAGLAGLIADIGAAEVADGVTLRPLSLPGSLELILGEVAELLAGRGVELAADGIAYTARTFRTAS